MNRSDFKTAELIEERIQTEFVARMFGCCRHLNFVLSNGNVRFCSVIFVLSALSCHGSAFETEN
jgi:hypothetical protein